MRLAVVIPLFQHAAYIGRTLESVLAQSRRPDRIIVLDDGSTDGSLAEARRFEARGVEVLSQENCGVSATVRRLMELASADCELIATLDSDDVFLPGRLACALPVFVRDPGTRLLVTRVRMIDADDELLAADHPRRRWVDAVWSRWQGDDTDLVGWVGQANFAVSNSNFIARREFFQEHPPKSYRFSYDYYLLIRAALEGSLRVLPEPLLDYRIHGANTMDTQPDVLVREQLRLWLDLYRDLAGPLAADAGMRHKFYLLTRASLHNVSALHAGMLQTLLARSAAALAPDDLAEMLGSLDPASWPELHQFPNTQALNLASTAHPLSPEAGALSDALSTLREQRDDARRQASALRDLARLRQRILESRTVAVARTLGLARDLATDAGRTPEEKLARLRTAVTRHRWSRHLSQE